MKTALVVGCADNVWEDVQAAQQMHNFTDVYCVKLAGVHWKEPFKVWATLHPEWMDDYEAQRHAKGFPNGYDIVAPLAGEVGMHGKKGRITRRVSYRWKGMTSSASSGIYAAKIALDDGYDRVVLAGVPMETGGNHFTRMKPWMQRDSFIRGFEVATPFLLGKVRSMSGHTKQVLGEPTPQWLQGDPVVTNLAQAQA